MQSYPRNYPRTGLSPAQRAKIILSEPPKETPEKDKVKEKVYSLYGKRSISCIS